MVGYSIERKTLTKDEAVTLTCSLCGKQHTYLIPVKRKEARYIDYPFGNPYGPWHGKFFSATFVCPERNDQYVGTFTLKWRRESIIEAIDQPTQPLPMSFHELAQMDDVALIEVAQRFGNEAGPRGRVILEEQLLRQLTGVSKGILLDVLLAPEAYDCPFGEAAMVSQFMVNELAAAPSYRFHEGLISEEGARELRRSFYNETEGQRYVDLLLEMLSNGEVKPLSPRELAHQNLQLLSETVSLGDFDRVNGRLKALGSSLRYTGGELKEGHGFQFLLFLEPPSDAVGPRPDVLMKLRMRIERDIVAPLLLDPESYLRNKAEAFERHNFMQAWCELVRSPLLPPDTEGVNFVHDDGKRYIHTWTFPLT